MRYSEQTIRDCNLLPSVKGTNSVFDFFHRTRTRGGSVTLEDMLTEKKDSVEEILLFQEAVKFISGDLNRMDLVFQNSDIIYLGEYFRSDLGNGAGDLEMNIFLRFKLSNNPTFLFIKSNIIRLKIFLKSIYGLCRQEFSDLPHHISNIFDVFRTSTEDDFIQELFRRDLDNAGHNFLIKADKYLRNYFQDKFIHLLDAVYTLDAFVSIAKTTIAAKLIFPSIGQSKKLSIVQGYHLLLSKPVANDFIVGDHIKLVFLTGANMAGKSTLFRTVGTIVCLGHSGFPVPAFAASIPFYDYIGVHISSGDNLSKGYSRFYNEVMQTKILLESIESGKNCFAIFDELFSGTNLNDAVDCANILIERLNHTGINHVLVSSHNIQLAGEKELGYVEYCHTETYISDGQPVFTYKLLPGKNEVKLGLLIFRQQITNGMT